MSLFYVVLDLFELITLFEPWGSIRNPRPYNNLEVLALGN